jgi:hypothetical protein
VDIADIQGESLLSRLSSLNPNHPDSNPEIQRPLAAAISILQLAVSFFPGARSSAVPFWPVANCYLPIAFSQHIGASSLRRQKSCIKDRYR